MRIVFATRSSQPEPLRVREQDVANALVGRPDLVARLEIAFDPDLNSFPQSMKGGAALVLPATIGEGWRERLCRLKEIPHAPHFVFVTGAGIDQLRPLDWLPRDVPLLTNRGVHAEAVTDYVTMALLLLNHAMPAQQTAWSRMRWRRTFPTSPAGKQLVVIGAGVLGTAAARAGRGLRMSVAGVRRHTGGQADFDSMTSLDGLDDLLPAADFVVLATPLTEETYRLVDRRRLSLLRPQAGLINISRGEVLDIAALVEALQAGALSGAVIDVLDSEPPEPTDPIWSAPNVIVTPHIAGVYADRYVPQTLEILLDAATCYLDNRQLPNLVDREPV